MTPETQGAAPVGSGVLHYVLTPEDVLAWERRSPKLRRRDRVALVAAAFAGIGLVKVIGGHMPDLHLLHSLPMAFVVIALPILAVMMMQRRDLRRRVADRVSAPVGVQLEVAPDRIVERREDRRAVVAFGVAGLREVVVGTEHVFLSTGADVVIVPFRAFATPDARAAFVAHWRGQAE